MEVINSTIRKDGKEVPTCLAFTIEESWSHKKTPLQELSINLATNLGLPPSTIDLNLYSPDYLSLVDPKIVLLPNLVYHSRNDSAKGIIAVTYKKIFFDETRNFGAFCDVHGLNPSLLPKKLEELGNDFILVKAGQLLMHKSYHQESLDVKVKNLQLSASNSIHGLEVYATLSTNSAQYQEVFCSLFPGRAIKQDKQQLPIWTVTELKAYCEAVITHYLYL